MSRDPAHELTLQLLRDLAGKLPVDRAREVSAQHELVLRLLEIQDEQAASAAARGLVSDALSI